MGWELLGVWQPRGQENFTTNSEPHSLCLSICISVCLSVISIGGWCVPQLSSSVKAQLRLTFLSPGSLWPSVAMVVSQGFSWLWVPFHLPGELVHGEMPQLLHPPHAFETPWSGYPKEGLCGELWWAAL